jgi:hypothetical protein
MCLVAHWGGLSTGTAFWGSARGASTVLKMKCMCCRVVVECVQYISEQCG